MSPLRHLTLAGLFFCLVFPTAFSARADAERVLFETDLPVDQVARLRGLLRLETEPCEAPRWRLERRLRLVAGELTPGLRALGYYAARIDATLDPAERDEASCWQATVRIEAGPRALWREVRVEILGEGADDAALTALRDRPALVAGQPLLHADYAGLKSRLLGTALECGYLDAAYARAQLRVDPEAGAADALLTLDTGPRYRIGAIEIDDGGLSPERVARMLGLAEGDAYSASAIDASHRRLRDAGYFKQVEVVPELASNATHTVPVRVALTPLAAKSWRFGAGFDTDTGPRVSAGFAHRRINEEGHQIDLGTRISRDISEISAEYMIPGEDPLDERWTLQTGWRDETTADIRSELLTVGANYAHTTQYPGIATPLKETIGLAYRQEHSQVADDDERSTLLLPSIEWLWSPAMSAGDGLSVRLGVKGAHESVLSDTSFTQLSLAANAQKQLGDDWTFLTRAEFGLSAIDGFDTLPASQRFFAGGDTSVRGYGFKRLGPHNGAGQVVGGRHLAVASVELERRVAEDWGVATFVDAGNAFNSTPELEYGYGLGARWRSPIGKVKLDLAIPSDTARDDFRLHFSLGASY